MQCIRKKGKISKDKMKTWSALLKLMKRRVNGSLKESDGANLL